MAGTARMGRRALLAGSAATVAGLALRRPPDTLARPSAPLGTGDDQDVTFESGGEALYGSLLLPPSAGFQPLAGALILAGSGPTDRNGNSAALAGDTGTLRGFAQALAGAGVVSLRYDKLGSGQTGLGSFASHPQDIAGLSFDVFVQEALDGLAFLAARPEVDPSRLLLLGHSEGGLIALVVAQQLVPQGGLAALALASPLAVRYLDLLRRQYSAAYAALVQSGTLTQAQADALTVDLGVVLDTLRATGHLPAQSADPSLRRMLASSAAFLYTADKYDPRVIASTLPALPGLLLHGAKDSQVLTAEMVALAQAFAAGDNSALEYDELPDVDHVYKVVTGAPDPATDYTNPDMPFAPDAVADLQAFARRAFG